MIALTDDRDMDGFLAGPQFVFHGDGVVPVSVRLVSFSLSEVDVALVSSLNRLSETGVSL